MSFTHTVKKSLHQLTVQAYAKQKRIIAPLAGFPGCDILGIPIKVAQQNHGMHYNCIEALVNLLKPDAAFMMMDLSVEANALGLPVRFPLYESSSVEQHPVESLNELKNYQRINIMQDARVLSYIKTIEMMSTGLAKNILVGAYIIGPFTLVGLLESAQRAALDSVLEPERLHHLCNFATSIIQEYARAITTAGADIICILEPTGSILGPKQFEQFSCQYVHHIIESYKYANVDTIYHVCGNTMHLLDGMAKSGVAALSLDSPSTGIDLAKAAQMVPDDIIVMGNVNPTEIMKNGTVKDVELAVTEIMQKMKPYPNFVLSTACDLPPGTPLENMEAFMQTGRQFK